MTSPDVSFLTPGQLAALKLLNFEVLPNGDGIPSVFKIPKIKGVLRYRVAYYDKHTCKWKARDPAFTHILEILNGTD